MELFAQIYAIFRAMVYFPDPDSDADEKGPGTLGACGKLSRAVDIAFGIDF
jgi:hypothetical protein